MIRFVKAKCAEEEDWEKANAAIQAQGWAYPPGALNHSLPNAAIILMGLLKGDCDFTKTVGITVMAGLDTDCTGATVGSIMGSAVGTAGIPSHWTDPLHDTIRSELKGICELRISEVAERMFEVAVRNVKRASPDGNQAR